MNFAWQRLTFDFTALESVRFPLLISGNILRGALGILSRKLACPATCPGVHQCSQRGPCLYSRVFEPSANIPLPSGIMDIPKPFVFRARHLDCRLIQPGEDFSFVMHLFTLDPEIAPHLEKTFASLEEHGLGPTRGRARLSRMTVEPRIFDLTPGKEPVPRVKLEFLTPTELKAHGRLAEEPHFPALFGRIRDRISTLRAIYGEGPFDLDFREMGQRADRIRLTSCEIRTSGSMRHSTRTGQTHDLGGFTGTATYEGELAEFLPWLELAQCTGVGRQAVWGKGEILLSGI